MPDEFKIKISADAGEFHAAATGAAGALDNLKSKTDAAGKSAAGSSELFKHLQHEGESTRKVFTDLSNILPEFRSGLELLFDPAVGLVSLGALAFGYATQKLAEYNQALDEQIAKNAEPQFLDAIRAKKDAIEEGVRALDDWISKTEHASDAEDHLAEGIRRAAALISAAHSSGTQLGDALFGLDEAKLKADYDNGYITFEQYQARLLKAVIQHNNDRLKAEIDYRAQLLALDQQQLSTAAADAPKAKATAEQAQAQATTLRAKADADQKLREQDAAQNEALKKKAADTASAAEHFLKSPWFMADYEGGGFYQSHLNKIAAKAGAEYSANQTQLDRLNETVPGEQIAADQAKQNADVQMHIYERLLDVLQELKQKISTEGGVNAILDRNGRAMVNAQNQTEIINSQAFQMAAATMHAPLTAILQMFQNAFDRLNQPNQGRQVNQ